LWMLAHGFVQLRFSHRIAARCFGCLRLGASVFQ
jgi:hypothetical protein